jgi:tRNA(fMet)-specific endonuclease VapC
MDPTLPGLVIDSGVLIAAERRKLTPEQAIESVRDRIGDVPLVLSPLTIAEIGHGMYRATTPVLRDQRRVFIDYLKAHVPIWPITAATGEIIARIGGEQAARGINLRSPT